MKLSAYSLLVALTVSATAVIADPFDEATCSGTAISYARASSFFSPGEDSAEVGDYTFQFRQRRCSQPGGCTAWEPAERLFELLNTGGEYGLFSDHGVAKLVFHAEIGANHDEFYLALDGDWVESPSTGRRGRTKTYFSDCLGRHIGPDHLRSTVVGSERIECTAFDQELRSMSGTPPGSIITAMGLSNNHQGRAVVFSGHMTDSCLQLISKSGHIPQPNSSAWVEKEAALLVYY